MLLDRDVTRTSQALELEKQKAQYRHLTNIQGISGPSQFWVRHDPTQHRPYGIYLIFYKRGRKGNLRPLGRQLTCPSYEDCIGMRRRFIAMDDNDVLLKEMRRWQAAANTPKVLDLDKYEEAVRERKRRRIAKKGVKSSLPTLKAKVTKERKHIKRNSGAGYSRLARFIMRQGVSA